MSNDNNKLVKATEDSALLKSLNKTTQLTSLADLVRVKTDVPPALLLDCSSSMDETVLKMGKTRIACLRQVVAQIKAKQEVPMIAFGPRFKDGGVPFNHSTDYGMDYSTLPVAAFVNEVPNPGGMTPLHKAIDFARENGLARLVLISDGGPDSSQLAMESAKQFGGRIDVVFVGGEHDAGQFFLEELAKATGGEKFEGDLSELKQLTGTIVALLDGDVEIVDTDDDDEDDDDEDDDDDEE
jgi:hypothetical protein